MIGVEKKRDGRRVVQEWDRKRPCGGGGLVPQWTLYSTYGCVAVEGT